MKFCQFCYILSSLAKTAWKIITWHNCFVYSSHPVLAGISWEGVWLLCVFCFARNLYFVFSFWFLSFLAQYLESYFWEAYWLPTVPGCQLIVLHYRKLHHGMCFWHFGFLWSHLWLLQWFHSPALQTSFFRSYFFCVDVFVLIRSERTIRWGFL